MDMRTCPKGHFYDGEVNATCPICAAESRQGGFDEVGATEPVGAGGFDDIGATEPIGMGPAPSGNDLGGATMGETNAPTHPFGESGETMRYYDTPSGVDNYSSETMPVSPGKIVGFTPVVGWLVCIDGPDKGNDYRIRTGYNHIGRGEHMDICIRGDQNISREKHALIAYDDTEKVFFFGPSEGRNIVRVNNKMVMVPTEIHAYDVLTVGSSRLMFVPLCGEHFDWSNLDNK